MNNKLFKPSNSVILSLDIPELLSEIINSDKRVHNLGAASEIVINRNEFEWLLNSNVMDDSTKSGLIMLIPLIGVNFETIVISSIKLALEKLNTVVLKTQPANVAITQVEFYLNDNEHQQEYYKRLRCGYCKEEFEGKNLFINRKILFETSEGTVLMNLSNRVNTNKTDLGMDSENSCRIDCVIKKKTDKKVTA